MSKKTKPAFVPAWKKYLPYPKPVQTRCGCKVSWYYYDNLADAEACSKSARHNAFIDLGLGYDFGYCNPGSIRPPSERDTCFHAHLYEVCIP